jgi:Lar family restriction alleviation protein
MAELKPCPFCGKNPVFYRSVFSEHHRIRCENGCGAETAPFGTKEKAIKAWNRRADNG